MIFCIRSRGPWYYATRHVLDDGCWERDCWIRSGWRGKTDPRETGPQTFAKNDNQYPVCGTSSAEASNETAFVRRRRGILVAMTTDFAIDFGFVIAGCVALIVLAAYHYRTTEGVWRICFGLGFTLPLVLVFFRIRLIESTQYRKHAIKRKIPYWLVIKRYWKPMLGTSLAW